MDKQRLDEELFIKICDAVAMSESSVRKICNEHGVLSSSISQYARKNNDRYNYYHDAIYDSSQPILDKIIELTEEILSTEYIKKKNIMKYRAVVDTYKWSYAQRMGYTKRNIPTEKKELLNPSDLIKNIINTIRELDKSGIIDVKEIQQLLNNEG